ncbi:MAG: thioredoxin domain-containing protein [Burkholderiaceae bacterium]
MDDVLTVVCLCAAWCGVCRDYAAPFEQAALAFGAQAEFTQLDIEDEAELLCSVDIENFPTLLIARGDQVLFFGTITPHVQTLTRLVQGALAGELKPVADAPEIDSLTQRLQAALALRSGSQN